MDTTQKTKIRTWQVAGLGVVSLSTILCIYPLANPLSRTIAEHSVYVMLTFLALGGIAFLLRQPFVMLYTWLACAALCHFLKDTQRSPFYYVSTEKTTNAVKIGHFDIKSSEEQALFLSMLPELEVDVISAQVTNINDFIGTLDREIASKYPHQVATFYQDEQERALLVFSKIPFDAPDTFHCQGIPYLIANLIVDSVHKKKIQFLSLHISENMASNPDEMMERLSGIGACWSARQYADMPMMAFGAIPAVAWSPEVRAFRSLCTLNDSRLDLELQANTEHIFYSNQMRCTHFESLPSGIGVIGTYQIKDPSQTASNTNIAIENTALTQR